MYEPICFGPKTPLEKYNEAKSSYNDFIADDTSIAKANAVCSILWDLIDWVNIENEIIIEFRKPIFEECPEFNELHDLENSRKHRKLSRPKASIARSRVTGSYSSDFSSDYDYYRLEIVYQDGKKKDLIHIINSVMIFWNKYFSEHTLY